MVTPRKVYDAEEIERIRADGFRLLDAVKVQKDMAIEIQVRYDPKLTSEFEKDSLEEKYSQFDFFLVQEHYRYLNFAFEYFGWSGGKPFISYEQLTHTLQLLFHEQKLDWGLPSIVTLTIDCNKQVNVEGTYVEYRPSLFEGLLELDSALDWEDPPSIIPVYVDSEMTPPCESVSFRTTYTKLQDDALRRFVDVHALALAANKPGVLDDKRDFLEQSQIRSMQSERDCRDMSLLGNLDTYLFHVQSEHISEYGPEYGTGYEYEYQLEQQPENEGEEGDSYNASWDQYDVLLWNPKQQVLCATECPIAIFRNGVWITPSIGCGAPWATFRQLLLERGLIEERIISVQDLVIGEKFLLLSDGLGTQWGRFCGSLPEKLPPKRVRPPKKTKAGNVRQPRRVSVAKRQSLQQEAEATSEALRAMPKPKGTSKVPGSGRFRLGKF